MYMVCSTFWHVRFLAWGVERLVRSCEQSKQILYGSRKQAGQEEGPRREAAEMDGGSDLWIGRSTDAQEKGANAPGFLASWKDGVGGMSLFHLEAVGQAFRCCIPPSLEGFGMQGLFTSSPVLFT